MKTQIEPRKVDVVDLTDLVPDDWCDWFFGMLNTANPDFSYGDNNLTLINPDRFASFIDDAFLWYDPYDPSEEKVSDEEWQAFIDEIRSLTPRNIYINVEE
jgi:hypothetical protein